MAKTALLTGFTGQDGSYLAELLLRKKYRVVAHVRPKRDDQNAPAMRRDLGASNHLCNAVEIHSFAGDSQACWNDLIGQVQPDEIYHLGASSSVRESWKIPLEVNHANIDLTVMLLEAMRQQCPQARFFFACSSEVFGTPQSSPQNELTPFCPCTPYGVTKAAGHWLIETYRQRFGLFLCSGILFNHESPRRPAAFVSRKITQGAVKIKLGLLDRLELGDLTACRDWGYAGDFVEAFWRMLQLDRPEDFVLGTGQLHSTKRFAELAFAQLGLTWEKHVTINPALFRANDPRTVVADISKARAQLGWSPETNLEQLVQIMVQADIDAITKFHQDGAAA